MPTLPTAAWPSVKPSSSRSSWAREQAAWGIALFLALGAGVLAAGPLSARPKASPTQQAAAAVAGRVTSGKTPLAAAKVYVYDVGSLRFEKALTDSTGLFLFRTLPAGLYKVIAIKEGFLPAIEVLRRWQKDAAQRLDLALAPADPRDPRNGETYWAVRSRVPADVLRDAAQPWSGDLRAQRGELDATMADLGRFETRLSAVGGMADVPDGYQGQLAAADIGLHGTLGGVDLGLRGSMRTLSPDDPGRSAAMSQAEQHGVALEIAAPGEHKISMSSSSSAMPGLGEGGLRPVDLEHQHVGWSGPTGATGHAGVSGSVTRESNYFQPGWIQLANLPSASRTLELAGRYSRDLGARTSMAAGVRFKERSGVDATDGLRLSEEQIDIFGTADRQVQPRVLVEVGLYSRVRDGSLSLMPSGSFVVDLGQAWKASTSVAYRFDREESGVSSVPGFDSARFGDRSVCERAGEACYEVLLSRGDQQHGQFSVGAIHREYAETLRLYFSDDFFHRLESLFLVRGDEVPELQVSWARRLAPKVLARLESHFAEGGGGVVYATDDRSFENEVRYLVTSIDAQFERTSTGVFVAFHHLEQSLNPIDDAGRATTQLNLERLQLMLTQDLDILHSLPSNWAVKLQMELSRGTTPYSLQADDALMKTLTGGIAVRF